MNKIFRGAALLLLAASGFGLARPAAAQAPALFPQTPATADAAAPDGAPPLPRVVPPKRPAPSAPGTINPTAPLAPAQAGVDLLAPPAVPSAWSATPTRATVIPNATAKTPAPSLEHAPAASYPASMTPAPRSAYSPAPPLPLAAPATPTRAPVALSPMLPNAQGNSLPTATRQTLMPKPAVASAAPILRPTPSKKVWPAAFQTRDLTKPYETTGVVYFYKPSQPVKQTAAIKPAPVVVAAAAINLAPVPAAAVKPAPVVVAAAVKSAPVVVAAAVKPAPVVVAAAVKPAPVPVPAVAASGDLRGRVAALCDADAMTPSSAWRLVGTERRITALCGADAMTVVTTKQPDGGTLVKVRVRDIDAEQKVTGKILQLPEMADPTVHLLVEVKP